MFRAWCKNEGVVMPNLEFPAEFENGVTGMRCKTTIKHREAYLFVPTKMMFTVDHVI